MKKLNRNEVNVITQEVRNAVHAIKVKDVKERSKKDKDAISLLRLSKEKKLLNDKIFNINTEMNKLKQDLFIKYNKEFQFMENAITGELDIWCTKDNCNNLYSKIILMGIDKDLKVNDLIDELVKEFSK
jgi:hypothetical protein